MKNDDFLDELPKRTDDDAFAETAQRWVMLNEIVCRVMMLYGYPPCMLCSFVQYCSVCAAYNAARSEDKKS